MSQTLDQVRALVARGDVRVSAHGYDELAADKIPVTDIVNGLTAGALVQDCPDYAKGLCVLALQHDHAGQPIHVVWGIPRGQASPAVVVTAYRPDPAK